MKFPNDREIKDIVISSVNNLKNDPDLFKIINIFQNMFKRLEALNSESPAKAEIHEKKSPMDFSEALIKLRSGNKIARGIWSPDKYLIVIIEHSSILEISLKAINGNHLTHGTYIAEKDGDIFTSWTPSQADLFAKDWIVV